MSTSATLPSGPRLEGEPHIYDYVKIKFKIEATNRPPNCPTVTWKEYKRQWLVLCTHIAPHQCFLTYCLQEDRWLLNKQALPQVKLENFALSNKPTKATIMGIVFGYFSIKLEFDSVSKLQQWAKALEIIRRRIYVELVRCPDHSHLEKEYVIQLEPDRIVFYDSASKDWKGDIVFEWTISVIKKVKYHNHIGKVQVEVGRSAESGAGIYYFIGFAIKRFFTDIKKRMEGSRTLSGEGRELTDSTKTKQTTSHITNSKNATLPTTLPSHVPHITSPIDPNRYLDIPKTNTTNSNSGNTDIPPPIPPPPIPPRPPKSNDMTDITPYYTHTLNEVAPPDIPPYDLHVQHEYDSFGCDQEVINEGSRKMSEPVSLTHTPLKPRPLPRSKSINARPADSNDTKNPQKIPYNRSMTHVPQAPVVTPHYQPLINMTTSHQDYDPVAISPDDPVPVLPTAALTLPTNVQSTYTLATFGLPAVHDESMPPARPPKPSSSKPPPPPYPPPFS